MTTSLAEIPETRQEAVPSLAGNFVEMANRLAEQSRVDAALDLIFARVDEAFQRGDFSDCDHLLQHLTVGDFDTDVLLGLLTATLPGRSLLPSRPDFYSRTEAEIHRRGEMELGLLTGLD